MVDDLSSTIAKLTERGNEARRHGSMVHLSVEEADALLDTLSPPGPGGNVEGLIERLDFLAATFRQMDNSAFVDICNDAAKALRSMDGERARLREALGTISLDANNAILTFSGKMGNKMKLTWAEINTLTDGLEAASRTTRAALGPDEGVVLTPRPAAE